MKTMRMRKWFVFGVGIVLIFASLGSLVQAEELVEPLNQEVSAVADVSVAAETAAVTEATTTEAAVEAEADNAEVTAAAVESAVDSAPLAAALATYKQTFYAHMKAGDVSTSTLLIGDATFNVSSDDQFIDYSVNVYRGNITGIVLACGPIGSGKPTIMPLHDSPAGMAVSGSVASGSIYEWNIWDWAEQCDPAITTPAHIAQAMREGTAYVTVTTAQFPGGEISGQVGMTPIPEYDTTMPQPATTSPATTTPGTATTTPETSTTTSPTTETPTIAADTNDEDNGSSRRRGGSRRIVRSTRGEVLGASTQMTCAVPLSHYIKAGAANDIFDTTLLQVFLNEHMDAGLTLTGRYDAATIAAVNQFQLKYSDEVLKPWVAFGLESDKTPTGYVYKTTQRMINNIICGSNNPMPQLP